MSRTVTRSRNPRLLWEANKIDDLLKLCPSADDAKDAALLFYGGLAHHARGRRRVTINCWRKAIRIKPDYDAAIRALAYELAESDKFIDASFLLERLVALNEATADDWTMLGELRMKQDRMVEAAHCFQEAIRIEPDNSLALLGMASMYALIQNADQALHYLEKTAATEDIDLSNLADDPIFELLWNNQRFESLVRAA